VTTYARREIVTTRVEYGVATNSDIGTFEKIKAIAFADYCRRHGLNQESSIAWTDDWARVEARDDEVVIVFAVKKPAPASGADR
jgi:hypothetical protein